MDQQHAAVLNHKNRDRKINLLMDMRHARATLEFSPSRQKPIALN
jgi:hypothetical protein